MVYCEPVNMPCPVLWLWDIREIRQVQAPGPQNKMIIFIYFSPSLITCPSGLISEFPYLSYHILLCLVSQVRNPQLNMCYSFICPLKTDCQILSVLPIFFGNNFKICAFFLTSS